MHRDGDGDGGREMGGQDGRRIELLLNGVGVGAGSGSQEVLVSGTRILKMRCRFDAAAPIPVRPQAGGLYWQKVTVTPDSDEG